MKAAHVKDALRSAFVKSKHCVGREWGGCLTAVEILALVDAGAKPRSDWNQKSVERAKEAKKAGKAFNTWFYFDPGKLEDELRKFKETNR